MNECFISVDIETTGPVPGLYSMFEIGATRMEKPEWDFSVRIQPLPETLYDKDALTAIGVTPAELERSNIGIAPRDAMRQLGDWVSAQCRGKSAPVFVGNNAPFDWMFVAWYFEKFGIANPFGHSALDMKAYFMGKTGCSWSEATLKRMAQYANVPFVKLPHRALDDAIIQAEIFSHLLHKP